MRLTQPLRLEMLVDGSLTAVAPSSGKPEPLNETQLLLIHALNRGLSIGQVLDLQGIDDGPEIDEFLSRLIDFGILEPAPDTTTPGEHPIRKLLPRSQNIPELVSPSWRDFFREYVVPERPAVLNGLIDDWPALQLWTPEYFNSLLNAEPDNTADQGEGRQYWLSQDLTREGATLSDLLTHVRFPYAQIGLQPQTHSLWYGPPRATLNNMHYDEHHNFIADVFGHKHFLLIPHKYSKWIARYSWQRRKDLIAPPGFLLPPSDPQYLPMPNNVESFECTLRPGQVLFLPSRCWHSVHAVDISITLAMFWEIPRILYRTRTSGIRDWISEKYRKIFPVGQPPREHLQSTDPRG